MGKDCELIACKAKNSPSSLGGNKDLRLQMCAVAFENTVVSFSLIPKVTGPNALQLVLLHIYVSQKMGELVYRPANAPRNHFGGVRGFPQLHFGGREIYTELLPATI